MEPVRKPFQGLWNIVRFNWYIYVLTVSALCGLLFFCQYLPAEYRFYGFLFIGLAAASVFISLIVSYYIYDLSGFYQLAWLADDSENINIANIHAGFDETSVLLKQKFSHAKLTVLDFYNSAVHTEVSIKRARKAYPPFPNTLKTATSGLPLSDHSVDKIFIIFAAHEIRNDAERVVFFQEIRRALKPNGQIFVAEHLRNWINFLAYNVGFLHFLSRASWLKTFQASNLRIRKEDKLTPFITVFTLAQDRDMP